MRGLLRVRYELDPAALRCELPPLMLSTLVENAVKHGITPSTNGGEIVVSVGRVDDRLELAVADSGVGFAHGPGGGSGIGLANTRARLRSLYGAQGRLDLASRSPQGVVASLQLPAREVNS
jgi:two-component system, LytTR family, sensor kinase